jgi:CHAD domain-containing protein
MGFDLDRVQTDIRKLRRFLKRPPKHAKPNKVHSVRTAVRRFQAAIHALGLGSDSKEKRLLSKLDRLRRRTGKVRDLDVLTGYLANLEVSGEEECLVQLLEHLGSEHADQTHRLYLFAVKHGESLRRRLKRTAGNLKASSKDGRAGNSAPRDTMLYELRLQRELIEPVRLTKNNLHPYRLRVKELRYMLQMEKDPADRELIETLGKVKDAIGEWHDWQQLVEIARDNLPHGSKCKLILLLQKTARQKLKNALAVANTGRRKIHSSHTGTDA